MRQFSRRAVVAAIPALTVAHATASAPPAEAATASLGAVARRWGPIGIVGDSQTVIGRSTLNTALATHDVGPWFLDGQSRRMMTRRTRGGITTAVEAVTKMRQRHNPGRWLIAIAGNDFVAYTKGTRAPASELAELMAAIDPAEPVGWITAWRRSPSWWPTCEQFNAALTDLAATHDNVTVFDWAAELRGHPEWFHRDGVHMHGEGIIARHRFHAEAAVTLCGG